MARRSATNERYGKHTSPSGKTRKSAAAAKPKRAHAESSVAAKKSSGSKPKSKFVLHPDTPEYKKWRRVWWALLISAMVLATAAWFLMKPGSEQREIGLGVLGAAYAMMAVAIYLDWSKLRKIRAAWNADGGKSAAKTDKAEKAETAKSNPSDKDAE